MKLPLGKHDIGEENLQWALEQSPAHDTLRALVALSREQFGWFSKQVSRAFEYPWVVGALHSDPRKPVLDIGAGISPLPLFLAHMGFKVVTVDNSPTVRRLGEGQLEWNGWGFLDYSVLHRNLRSTNCDVLEVDFPASTFAAIYSVSVIEHLHSQTRRQLWDRLRRWLEPGGQLLVTFDLVPGTNRMWNRNQGQEVESPFEHGDLSTVISELEGIKFSLADLVELRELPGMDVDCAMLSFIKN